MNKLNYSNIEINCKLERNFFLIILLIGMLLNMFVVSANDYRMPVKTEYEFNTTRHFNYTDKEDVKFWWYSDILGLSTKNYIILLSFGDLLMFIGISGLFWNSLKRLFIQIKRKKSHK